MLKFFTEKDVKTLVARLKEEYGKAYERQRAQIDELKEENRRLAARVSELESDRAFVGEALTHAVAESDRIVAEGTEVARSKSRELMRLTEQCRTLCARLTEKYPDEEDVRRFTAFTQSLQRELGLTEQEEALDMNLILNPGELDLEQLCRELGLMEDKS